LEISYDPAKNARNIALRGLSFDRAAEFDFERARVLSYQPAPRQQTRDQTP